MKQQPKNLCGEKYGRWTVIDSTPIIETDERKWRCRCDCGTERYVLERSLLYGGSHSCGCLRDETFRSKVVYDLTGKSFGELTVLHKAEHQKRMAAFGGLAGVPAETLTMFPQRSLLKEDEPIARTEAMSEIMLQRILPADASTGLLRCIQQRTETPKAP